MVRWQLADSEDDRLDPLGWLRGAHLGPFAQRDWRFMQETLHEHIARGDYGV